MRIPMGKTIALAAGAAVLAAGFFLLGHVSADADGVRAGGYRSGQSAGYFGGLQAGEAQGREEGRALQVSDTVPADSRQPVQDAFTGGYAAGANDSFGNYDGGWAVDEPYLVTVTRGSGQIIYRLTSRTTLQTGVNYYLCPDGRTICHDQRH